MVIPTPLLGLPKAEGADNARDFLKGAIGGGGLWHALEVLDNAVMLTGAQTLVGKTLTGATLTSPVITTPTGDVVTPAGVQTLTNKTLTSPVITTPTGDVVTPAGVQTLTNKTLSLVAASGNALTMPQARAFHTVAQAVANGTVTALALDSERFDTDAIHDLVTNTSRLTCKTAGVYLIEGGAAFASNATGARCLLLRLNGTTYIRSVKTPATSGDTTELSLATLYTLAATDYVELCAYQLSGGSLNTVAAGVYSPEVAMTRVG